MQVSTPRKAKISLSDYSYLKDIKNRIILSQLTQFEILVLQAIINHSLTISIEQLANELKIPVGDLLPILDKLAETQLFRQKSLTLYIDKEVRKYFEFQIKKFDDDFQPDFDYLQNILNNVPIPVLPIWYAITPSSDDIFSSIIEKYFLTPQIYRLHLNDIQSEDLILKSIIQDIYQAPDFKISGSEIKTKYNLPQECFHKYILCLEFHLIACLNYTRIDDLWHEIVTPFFEWREFLQFEKNTHLIPINESIERSSYKEFSYIHNLISHLQNIQSGKPFSDSKCPSICHKLLQVGFIKQPTDGSYVITNKGSSWLLKSFSEKVAHLAADPLNVLSNVHDFTSLWNIRNLNLIEKSLSRLRPNIWVAFDQFLEGFITPIGNKDSVVLKNKGKKWKYVLPTYSNEEKQFIKAVIMERLAEIGIVETGTTSQGIACFSLTHFGYHFIH